ncbi:MAG: hypothetical protein ACYDAQ_01670, partial [Mycobacteriales bacterium]
EADRLGAALWPGEWGSVNPSTSPNATGYLADMLSAQDADLLGSAYWCYTRGGWPLTPAERFVLTRPSPFAIAGTLETFASSRTSLQLAWRAGPGTTEVSLPAGFTPRVAVLAGGAQLHWRTSGSGWLALSAPVGTRVDVTVTATPARAPQGSQRS